MQKFLEMYGRLAEKSSGIMTISVMQTLVISVLARKMASGTLSTIDLAMVSGFFLLAVVGALFSLMAIWNIIEKIVPTAGTRFLLGIAYYPVLFGVFVSGLVTAGVVLKY